MMSALLPRLQALGITEAGLWHQAGPRQNDETPETVCNPTNLPAGLSAPPGPALLAECLRLGTYAERGHDSLAH